MATGLQNYGLPDDNPQANPWLTGADTLVPTDPQAQVLPGSPWGQTATPTATPDPSASLAPAPAGAPQGSTYTTDLGKTGWDTAAPSAAAPAVASTPAQNPNDQAAAAHDTLSRKLQADLEADGHQVTWKDGQLIVDGRPYEVAGTPAAASSNYGYDPNEPDPAPLPDTPPTSPSTVPPGGWPTTSTSPTEPGGVQLPSTQPAPAGGSPFEGMSEEDAFFAAANALGFADNQARGHAVEIAAYLNGHGYPGWKASPTADDWIQTPTGATKDFSLSGSNARAWMDDNGDSGPAASSSNPWMPTGSDGGLSNLPDWLTNPHGDPDLEAIAATIPGFEEIYARLTAMDPNEEATAALVKKILDNPEALSDRDVEMLKAASAEEAAVAGQANDEDLKHFGAATGQDSSPWLAGQRATNAAATRNAMIVSNRNVDVSAANTRQANRLASANVAQAWDEYRQGKSVQAINAAMQSVATKGSIEQAAKQLGMTKAQLSIAYIGQNLNYNINLQSLLARSSEFQQQLAFQIAQLRQNDDQFLANFGLNVRQQSEVETQNAWLRSHSATT